MPPPPPPPEMSLQQRVVQLAQTLQFAWFVGHVCLLLAGLRYSLSYMTFNSASSWAAFSYRAAFVSAAVTYGIVVYKGCKSRARQNRPIGLVVLVLDENVQYLIMALVWLLSRQVPLAIAPFAVYSVFHVATYVRGNLLPTLAPPRSGAAGARTSAMGMYDAIGGFVKQHYDTSMLLVSGLEISLWLRVLVSALLLQRGSWVLLVAYSVFFRARVAQSAFVQDALARAVARGDVWVGNRSNPPAVQQAWGMTKNVVRATGQYTDLGRWLGGGAPSQARVPQKKET